MKEYINNYTTTILIIIVIILGLYIIVKKSPSTEKTETKTENTTATTTTNMKPVEGDAVSVGKSVNGTDIVAFNYGKGDTRLLFIGGIHGGYSWNTTLVAYELMAYLRDNPEVIPENVKVTVIPVMNPDGLSKVVPNINKFNAGVVNPSQELQVAGRFNANNVDLSRNFDCDWQANAKWQTTPVSGGTSAFSEPESLAVKNYVETYKPSAVVVWYSAAGGVYASSCGGSISDETVAITNTYAKASGYPAYNSYDFYETTGDLPNWLAKINVPAISVLLTTHDSTEWNKNMKGVDALLSYFAK